MTHDRLQVLTMGGASSSENAPHLLGSLASDDLNVNMLRFSGEGGIEEHVNNEVDVLIVALDGEGVVTVDGAPTVLAMGDVTIIPKGTARSIRSNGERFAWLTCHGRRRGMMPSSRSVSPEGR